MDKIVKLEKFFSYLKEGYLLKVDGRTYGMTRDYQLYILPYNENGEVINDLNEAMGMSHMPLTFWLDIVDKIGEDELTVMAANMVLTEFNRGKQR